jgi:cold shock CspA family protein
MSMTGNISTLFRVEEYAIISPSNGGPGIFVHACDFGLDWNDLALGVEVEFSFLQDAQGLKAYNVTVLSCKPLPYADLDDRYENSCAVSDLEHTYRREFDRVNYEDLIASVLISTVPEIRPEQVSAVCRRLTEWPGFQSSSEGANLERVHSVGSAPVAGRNVPAAPVRAAGR